MSFTLRLRVETVRLLDHASILAPGSYTGIGTPINNPARMLLIQNFTDALLMFSFDGINDHFPLIALSHLILDISNNRTKESSFFLAGGERLYVCQIDAPTSGSVYLTSFYGRD